MKLRQAKKILFGPCATWGHHKWSWDTINAAKRRYRKLPVGRQKTLVRGWRSPMMNWKIGMVMVVVQP